MIKTYMGIPGANGLKPVVTVVGDGSRALVGDFGWGKNQPKGGDLARAILADHLGSADLASRYYRRFMWRTVVGWDPTRAFTLTGAEIDEHMAQIRESDVAANKARTAVAAEQAPVASEGGIGPGGVAFSKIERKS